MPGGLFNIEKNHMASTMMYIYVKYSFVYIILNQKSKERFGLSSSAFQKSQILLMPKLYTIIHTLVTAADSEYSG